MTITTTAMNFAEALVALGETDVIAQADSWRVAVISGTINVFFDGLTPTSAYGMPFSGDSVFEITGVNSKNLNMIGVGGDAKISIEAKNNK